MTESFYLRKPYLALPMRGQFEQEINGFLLARLKYGINLRRASAEAVGHFLYRIPDFAENLKTYQAQDNRAIKARLTELLADNCALARGFSQKTKAPEFPEPIPRLHPSMIISDSIKGGKLC